MDIDQMILYSSFIMLIGLGLTFFYEAFIIQKQRGVVVTKIIMSFIFPMISFFYLYLEMVRLEVDPILLTGIILCFFVLLLISYYFRDKKKIVVYDITLEDVIALLESELTKMSIPFTIKNGMYSEEIIFSLNNDKSKIIVEGGFLGEDRKTYTLLFNKWRYLLVIDELHYNIVSAFREKQENKVFWSQMLINCILGSVFISIFIFLFWKILNNNGA